MTEIKGDRTRHVITLNPNKASPGEELYVDIPRLKEDKLLGAWITSSNIRHENHWNEDTFYE